MRIFDVNRIDDWPMFLTTAEVATVLRLSRETVRRMAAAGTLPSHRNPGRNSHLRFRSEAIIDHVLQP